MDTAMPTDLSQLADIAQTVTVSLILLYWNMVERRRADTEREKNAMLEAEYRATLERFVISQTSARHTSSTPP